MVIVWCSKMDHLATVFHPLSLFFCFFSFSALILSTVSFSSSFTVFWRVCIMFTFLERHNRHVVLQSKGKRWLFEAFFHRRRSLLTQAQAFALSLLQPLSQKQASSAVETSVRTHVEWQFLTHPEVRGQTHWMKLNNELLSRSSDAVTDKKQGRFETWNDFLKWEHCWYDSLFASMLLKSRRAVCFMSKRCVGWK